MLFGCGNERAAAGRKGTWKPNVPPATAIVAPAGTAAIILLNSDVLSDPLTHVAPLTVATAELASITLVVLMIALMVERSDAPPVPAP